MRNDTETSEESGGTTSHQLTLFAEAIPALYEAKREQIDRRNIPTCPDITSPWLHNAGPDGYSAKMFLHQMMSNLHPHWNCLDTERLLSPQMPHRLPDKTEGAISLSDVLKKPGFADSKSYISEKASLGILKREKKRRRGILVLLRTASDTMRVTVSFGKDGEPCVLRTAKSVSDFPDSLSVGLMDYLKHVWRNSQETP